MPTPLRANSLIELDSNSPGYPAFSKYGKIYHSDYNKRCFGPSLPLTLIKANLMTQQ